MPSYVKFLKDILSKNSRIDEFETMALTQECNAMLRTRILTKMKDSRSFTIPYSIGSIDIGKTLYDLGASINLMPLFMFKKLRIESRPTTVILQLVD